MEHFQRKPKQTPKERDEEFRRIENNLRGSISLIRQFVANSSAEDFIYTTAGAENKTQYKKRGGKARKNKKPRPEDPTIYIIDAWVDLQIAVSEGNWREAFPLYYYLKKIKEG